VILRTFIVVAYCVPVLSCCICIYLSIQFVAKLNGFNDSLLYDTCFDQSTIIDIFHSLLCTQFTKCAGKIKHVQRSYTRRKVAYLLHNYCAQLYIRKLLMYTYSVENIADPATT